MRGGRNGEEAKFASAAGIYRVSASNDVSDFQSTRPRIHVTAIAERAGARHCLKRARWPGGKPRTVTASLTYFEEEARSPEQAQT